MGAIADAVSGIISSQQGFADGALSAAESALGELSGLDFQYTTYGDVGAPTYGASSLVPPSAMQVMGELGEAPPVSAVSFPPAPPNPDITIPPQPDIVYPEVPVKPDINPVAMDSVILGALMSYVAPEKPPIYIPPFEVAVPEPLTITPVEHFFSVDTFSFLDDPIIAAIRNRLTDNIVYGGTGLSPAVEEAIWARNLERNERQLSDSLDKTYRTWAERGFSLPDGMLSDSVATLQREYMNKQLDLSREIAIKQAELEQTNVFKSMELGVSFVGKLVEAMVDYDKLILQMQENNAKFANEYIRLQIETNNNFVDVYKAKIQAYELQLRAEMTKMDIYKTDVQAVAGILQANESVVKIYATQIEAAVAKFKGQVEGNAAIVQVFAEEVRAALATAGIEEAKIKIYTEIIRALATKAEVFKSQVESMTAEINAERAKIEANVAQIEGWSKQANVQIEKYKAEVERYRAEASYNTSAASVEAAFADANAKMYIGAVSANAEYAKVSQMSIQASQAMREKAAEAVAITAGHLAAGAMSAVNAGANLQATETSEL